MVKEFGVFVDALRAIYFAITHGADVYIASHQTGRIWRIF